MLDKSLKICYNKYIKKEKSDRQLKNLLKKIKKCLTTE